MRFFVIGCLLVAHAGLFGPSGLFPSASRAAAGGKDKKKEPEKKRKPGFTIGKETTVVTGPVDAEGFIDYPAALNERLGKGVTPENNAVVPLRQALGPREEGGERIPAAFYKLVGIDEPPAKGEYFIEAADFPKERLTEDEIREASQRPWTAKEHPRVVRWLAANKKPLNLALEASKRTHYFHPLVPQGEKKNPALLLGATLPSTYRYRRLAEALAIRAMHHLGEGRDDEAWRDLIAVHRLARHISRSARLVDGLIGPSLEESAACPSELLLLQMAKMDVKTIQRRLGELQSLPPPASLADSVDLGERFTFLDVVMMLSRNLTEASAEFRKEHQLLKDLPDDFDWNPMLKDGNRFYDRMVAAMRLKDRALRQKLLDAIDKDIQALKIDPVTALQKLGKDPAPAAIGKMVSKLVGDEVIRHLLPGVQRVRIAEERAEQRLRNVQVAFALAAYQRDKGSYPAKLDDLTPNYLAKTPLDLFSGKALIYRPMDKGYLLYSVGANGEDEGGRSHDDEPPGDDLVVRMPSPKLTTTLPVPDVD